MKNRFICLLLMVLACVEVQAQGAWIPPNADLTYPRTLLKSAEIADVQAYLSNPEIFALYNSLWASAQSVNPANLDFNVNGERRVAAHGAKNAAFIYLLDRRPNAGALDTLTDQEASALRNKAIDLMERMNTTVETYPNFGNYLWRSNEITDNLIAYDLLKGAGVPDSSLANSRALLQEYAGNLYEQVSWDVFNLGLFSLHVDNHSLRSCGALGLAAVVLNDATSGNANDRPSNWIDCALYNIDNILWRDSKRQSEPGLMAGYSEGPHYFRFGMKHNLDFFHALQNFVPDTILPVSFDGNNRTVRHPWYDPDMERLYEWMVKIRMPDGRHPAIEDCFIAAYYPELAILEKPEYRVRMYFDKLHPMQANSLWEQLHHSSDDVVAEVIASRTSYGPVAYKHMIAMPEAGNLIFRSGWDTTATYMHLQAKYGRSRLSVQGHNHVDVTSFILYAHGQLLALDPGYLKWDRRDEVDEAQNHSMILVDGAGPAGAVSGNAGDADGYIEQYFDLTHLDYGEIRTTYQGADILRKPLFIRENYFVLGDFCSASGSHTYQWRLQGYGVENGDSTFGTFELDTVNHRGIYRKNGVTLLAHVTATGAVDNYGKESNIHEIKYDSLEEHTTFLANKQGTDAQFLSVLAPYLLDSPSVQTLCAPDCGAVKVVQGNFEDFFFTSGEVQASASGLQGDLRSDAGLGFYSRTVAADFAQFFYDEGSWLVLGADTLGSSSVAMDLAFQVIDSVHYEGYAGAPGTIRLSGLLFTPGSVLGSSIVNWSYDQNVNILTILTNGQGKFDVYEDVIIHATAAPQRSPGAFRIWPVPTPAVAGFEFRIMAPEPGASYRMELLTEEGRLVKAKDIAMPNGRISTEGIPAGLYFVRLKDGKRDLGTLRQVILR